MNYNGLDNFSYKDLVSFRNVYKAVRNVSISTLPFTSAYALLGNHEIGGFIFFTNALLAGNCERSIQTANAKISERESCRHSLVKRHRMR